MGILLRFRVNLKESALPWPLRAMELVCEKYREKMAEADACCHHPNEYCKFRPSCLIHFLGKERDQGLGKAPEEEPQQAAD